MTQGETEVLEFFDSLLEPEWEMYVQPHLNGLRPDLVLLHKEVGVAVFEIKDWRLADVNYRHRSSAEVTVTDRSGRTKRDRNPLAQVMGYEDELRRLYSPRLRRASAATVLTAGVIFTRGTTSEGIQLVHGTDAGRPDSSYPVSGMDALAAGDVATIFPAIASSDRDRLAPEIVEDLRAWLVEPRYSSDMRLPFALDARQRLLAGTRPSKGFRRIRGPAGSGKTLVLVSRASQIQEENSSADILFVTYNITLLNFLGDFLARAGARSTEITRLHFHAWAKRVLYEVGWKKQYEDLWKGSRSNLDKEEHSRQILGARLAELIIEALADPDLRERTGHFDAILVDEGQDFLPEWWSALRKVLRQDGEMVLAADFGQGIYGRDNAWTENPMMGAGFAGQWAELKTSYRVPEQLRVILNSFAERFGNGEFLQLVQPAQTQMDTCQLEWRSTASSATVNASVTAVFDLVRRSESLSSGASDVAVVVDNWRTGREIEASLRATAGYRILSTLGKDADDSRERKLAFGRYRERSNRISITTIHSFKGFEAPLVVVVLTGTGERSKRESVAYTALSRLAGEGGGASLIVVSSDSELNRWGETWPKPRSQG